MLEARLNRLPANIPSMSLARKLDPKPLTGGRWRRFRQRLYPPDGNPPPVPGLPWRALLNRGDALILDIRTIPRGEGRAQVLAVTVIDTTGAARLAAMASPPSRFAVTAGTAPVKTRAPSEPTKSSPLSGRALPWPKVHGHLALLIESAAVVLAWDAPSKARLVAGTARKHGLTLPPIPWRDLRSDYRRLGYLDDSITAAAAKLHVAAGTMPSALAPCHRILAVMRACGH